MDTSFLGDVLCAEPMVRAAAKQWQDQPIDFLTSTGGSQILEGHPQLRHIMAFDKRGKDRGLMGLARMASRLKKLNYERAICSHRSWRTAALLCWAGIPERVGFNNASAAWMYSRRVAYRKDLHEVERNLQLLGGGEWTAPRMYPGAAEQDRAAELVADKKWIAMAPGSIWATKRWPEERWSELLGRLTNKGHPCMLLGGPDDQELCKRVVAAAVVENAGSPDPKPGVLDLSGQTTLRESAAILERAAVVISNDSAPMHLGVSVGIPVVAVFCSTVPAFGFAPRGKLDTVIEVEGLACKPCGIHGHPTCPEGHFKCGFDVSASRVYEAVLDKLCH